MDHKIDLARIHFKQEHGGLTAYGTWIMTEDAWRPALVLIRTGDENSDHCVPCVVTGDKIWVWTEEVGDEVRAAHMCAAFLDPLRLSPNAQNIIKILSVIRFHIGDVLSIPPRPIYESKHLGTMRVVNKTLDTVVEREVIGHA